MNNSNSLAYLFRMKIQCAICGNMFFANNQSIVVKWRDAADFQIAKPQPQTHIHVHVSKSSTTTAIATCTEPHTARQTFNYIQWHSSNATILSSSFTSFVCALMHIVCGFRNIFNSPNKTKQKTPNSKNVQCVNMSEQCSFPLLLKNKITIFCLFVDYKNDILPTNWEIRSKKSNFLLDYACIAAINSVDHSICSKEQQKIDHYFLINAEEVAENFSLFLLLRNS